MFMRRSSSCRGGSAACASAARGFRRGVGEIALHCRAQCRFVGLKLRRKIALEAVPVVRIEGAQHVVQFARDLRAGRLAAFRQQCRCELFHAIDRRGLRVGQAT
jgi:hypothetical protein